MTNRAIDRLTKQPIISFDFLDSVECKKQHPEIICSCGKALYPRGGRTKSVRMHFAHISKKDGEICDVEKKYANMSRRDLTMHSVGVEFVRNYLLDKISPDEVIDIEFPIGNRRADVVILDRHQRPIEVHEIQLTKQSISELDTRSNDYVRNGCLVTWWFGDNCATPDIEQWAIESQGEFLRIFFDHERQPSNLNITESILYKGCRYED